LVARGIALSGTVGLGVQPPMAPSTTIVLITLSASLLGDWLRDRLDPTLP
jgi:ABC-type dipeptide/oligopeptide/nickel transport system permease subunit